MPPPGDNVWIGDLPIGMDKGSLASLFEAYGQVVECRMLPGKDETAKPCAMLRFANADMAAWVVENLNGNIPEGLAEPIIVRFANAPRGKGGDKGAAYGAGPYGGGGGWQGGGGAVKGGFQAPPPSDNVWVGDLPVGTEKHDLNGIFEAYGQIVDCRMLPGRDPTSKPAAMVRFSSVDQASWVVQNLHGNVPQGLDAPLIVRFANAPGGKGGAQQGQPAGGWQAQAGGGWHKGGGGVVQDSWGKGMAGKGVVLKGAAGGKGGGKAGTPGSFQSLFQSVKGAGILGGGTVPDECQVYIRNLPSDTTDLDLYRLFAPFGAIPPTGVKAMMNPDGSCKGIGFVDLAEPDAAATAVMALDGHALPDGSSISVSTKKPSLKAKGKSKGGTASEGVEDQTEALYEQALNAFG